MPVTQETYRRLVLEDPEGNWELHRGQLREKPSMAARHNRSMLALAADLLRQLDPSEYDVRRNSGRARRTDETYYVLDVMVIPADQVARFIDRSDVLEVYDAPLPLVVEVWSPSTGGYDVDSKLPEYQRRGDLEIWRLHPFERTLRVWRKRDDGTYDETEYRGGRVEPHALPGVGIDLDALFA